MHAIFLPGKLQSDVEAGFPEAFTEIVGEHDELMVQDSELRLVEIALSLHQAGKLSLAEVKTAIQEMELY